MLTNFQNNVQIAIDRIGGPTKAAHELEVSNTAIHTWIRDKGVPDIDKAKKLEELSGVSHELLRRTK